MSAAFQEEEALGKAYDSHLMRRLWRYVSPYGWQVAATIAMVVPMFVLELAPAWMVALIIGREFAITGLRSLAYTKGITMPASPLGKIKMNLEAGTIGLLLLGAEVLGKFHVLSEWGLWLTVVAALASAAEYYLRYGRAVLSNRS